MYIFALIVATGLLSSCAQTENIVTSKLPDDACDCPEQQEDLMSRGLYINKSGNKVYIHKESKTPLSNMNTSYIKNNSEFKPNFEQKIVIGLD